VVNPVRGICVDVCQRASWLFEKLLLKSRLGYGWGIQDFSMNQIVAIRECSCPFQSSDKVGRDEGTKIGLIRQIVGDPVVEKYKDLGYQTSGNVQVGTRHKFGAVVVKHGGDLNAYLVKVVQGDDVCSHLDETRCETNLHCRSEYLCTLDTDKFREALKKTHIEFTPERAAEAAKVCAAVPIRADKDLCKAAGMSYLRFPDDIKISGFCDAAFSECFDMYDYDPYGVVVMKKTNAQAQSCVGIYNKKKFSGPGCWFHQRTRPYNPFWIAHGGYLRVPNRRVTHPLRRSSIINLPPDTPGLGKFGAPDSYSVYMVPPDISSAILGLTPALNTLNSSSKYGDLECPVCCISLGVEPMMKEEEECGCSSQFEGPGPDGLCGAEPIPVPIPRPPKVPEFIEKGWEYVSSLLDQSWQLDIEHICTGDLQAH